MRTGLEKLFSNIDQLSGQTLGVCCNHTAIDRAGNHIIDLLKQEGVQIKRLFGPEHGIDATAQDMIAVDEAGYVTPIETVSLYGETEASLHPLPETLSDLDTLVFDIQDIGSRYYTYQASLAYIMEVAANTNTRILVLDRPNPINGIDLNGNIVQAGFESFVSAYPIATRHAMTMGELGIFFRDVIGIDVELDVLKMENWNRHHWYEETGLPWVYPSPNMPTVETAIIYVGMCLLEGTNISEGRGTTKPFHIFGAPWINRVKLTDCLRKCASDAGLEGVIFRPATFEPRFQKHSGKVCHGAEIIVTDRNRLEPLLLGVVVLEALIMENPERFKWRTETYEYVDDPIAIDLLFGNAQVRGALEVRVPSRQIVQSMEIELPLFQEQREKCLLYP